MSFKDFFHNIPQNWEIVTLPEVLSFIVDNRGKSVPTAESGIPLIATNCIRNERLYPNRDKIRYVSEDTYKNWFKSYPEPNDIIFVNKGTPGRVCLVPENIDFCFAQDMVALRANEKIDYRYLLACLRSEFFQEQVRSYSVGTMIPHCRKGDLEKLLLPLPTIKEQEYIGKIYLLFSEKIELNNEINNTLEEMAQSLFKRWFVDFEFPNEDGEPYKSSGGEMVDSELGMIPNGWEVKSIYDLAEYVNGTSFKAKDYSENGLPIIKIAELKNGITDGTKFFSGEKDKKFYLKNGDILFSWSGNPDTSIDTFIWDKGDAILNQHIFKVIPKFDKGYAFTYLMLKYLKSTFTHIARNKQTTGLGHVTVKDLKELKIALCFSKIKEFNEVAEPIVDLIFENNMNIELLNETRNNLLPKLMNGEISLN